MSECICKDYGPVSDVHVYGLHESVKKAKYPMSVDVNSLNATLTPGIQSLAQSGIGEGHDQWLTGIVVAFDLTYTVKAWTEAERYRFLYFISSQSTMHRIAKFNLDEQYDEHTDPRCIKVVKELVEIYNETKDPEDYLRILYSNPCGMKLTAGMVTNYRQLKTIYRQRRNHRLPEWREFCKWIETLPMAKELILPKEGEAA